MIIRTHPIHILATLSILQATSLVAVAQDNPPFDCHLTADSFEYNLTALAGVHTVSRKRETPPTSMEDSVRFDLCGDLPPQEGVPEGDQCPTGTRACFTKVNKKADSSDRIIAVIPIAQTGSLNPQYSAISSPSGLSLVLHGASYPHPGTAITTPQSFNLTLLCATNASEPKILEYDGSQLRIEWSVPSACGQPPENPEEGKGGSKESVGSGVGFFFTMLLLAFAAYFGLGAYYNYTTYGATGFDLIPHRDFWKEMPYMLHDVISHLCSSVRPRHSNRGGYIAV